MRTWLFGCSRLSVQSRHHFYDLEIEFNRILFGLFRVFFSFSPVSLSNLGTTFRIPDAVMGLTFLAAGGCLPEGISSVLMVRKNEGGVGVSNSLGANSLAILMSLGIPWLIRNIMHRNRPGQESIQLNPYSTEYNIMLLLFAIIALYVVLTVAKYRLKRSVGLALISIYIVLITFGILLEMNVFFPVSIVS